MKSLAIGLWLAQLLAAMVMLVVAAIQIESILISGPILALIGLILALVTRPLQSWLTLSFALSAPLVTALIALMIAVFELGPEDARMPTRVTLAIYLAMVLPLAAISWLRIVRWNMVATWRGIPALHFSLKTLLLVMTGIGVLFGAGHVLFNARLDETLFFGGYALIVLTLSALIAWQFSTTRIVTKLSHPPKLI